MNGIMEKYFIYEYDDGQNLVRDSWYNSFGDLDYKIENTYSNGKISESRSYNGEDNLEFVYEYHYDEAGTIIEEVQYDGEENKIGVIQYVYKYY